MNINVHIHICNDICIYICICIYIHMYIERSQLQKLDSLGVSTACADAQCRRAVGSYIHICGLDPVCRGHVLR